MSGYENTLERVKRLRVDALYGKKKHYNAADRKQKYHLRCGVPAALINIVLSSVLIALLADSAALTVVMKWVGAGLSLTAAILGGLQTWFNWAREVEGHRAIAARYLAIAKECSRMEGYVLDGKVDAEVLHEQLERLAHAYDQVTTDASAYPTNSDDYHKAQQGFSVEESYTQRELQHRGE